MVTCQTCHCHMAPDRAKDMSMTWSQRNHPGDSHILGRYLKRWSNASEPISKAGHGTERSFHMEGQAQVRGMLQAARAGSR